MAGGALLHSDPIYDTNGNIYPGIYTGSSNSRKSPGHVVVASLGANSVLTLEFEAPQVLPSGTPYLRVRALANGNGNGVFNPAWASVAVGAGEGPDNVTPSAEGNTTITWSSDQNDFKEAKVQLDADTIVADEIIHMEITFVSASWTLAVISVWEFSIIWE